MSESNVLREAAEIIRSDREKTYGDTAVTVRRIAAIWSAILSATVTPEQVCLCMAGLKLARLANDSRHHDSLVDLAGYAALLERIQEVAPDAQ